MTILRASIFATVAAAFLTACGGGSDNGAAGTTSTGGQGTGGVGGAGTGGSTGFMPAAHPAAPQVITFGGPALKTPKVQPIVYSDDPAATDIDKFLQELTTSTFWSETTSEYKVGPLVILPTIVRPEKAPASLTDDMMNQDLATNLTGSAPAWGAADGSTIYLFIAPPQTQVSDPTGTGCQDYDGYHSESQITGSLNVPYAIGCACPGFDGKGVSALQQRTVAISHELVEAATDPFPSTNPAWAQTDNADIVWTIATGGELADMCEFNDDSYAVPAGSTYMIQRSWSNKAAKAGTNPCVPVVSKGPYFNTSPILPDMIKIAGGGPTISTPGVTIPVGGSKSIPLTLWSEAPTSGPWKVSVIDLNYYLTGSSYLKLTLDKNSGQNGDTVMLTINVLKSDPQFKAEAFLVFSDLGGQSNLAMGWVGQ